MEERLKLNILSAVSFMDLFAVGLTVPLFSNHVRELGGSHFFTGFLSSTYSAIQLFSGPLVGSWSDRRGRKNILMVTLLINSICYFTMGITSSLYILFFTRVILGFTKQTQTLCKALIADTVSKEQQSAVYGRTSAVSMIGFVIGPAIGGHLSEFPNGYYYVCLLTSILFGINIALTNIISCSVPVKQEENSDITKELLKVITDLTEVNWRSYWSIFATKFLHAVAISVYFYNYSLTLQEKYGLTQKIIGYTISFQSCIGMISGFLTGWINETFYKNDETHTKKLFYGFSIMSLAFILLCITSHLYYFLLSLIPLAIANSFLRIVETEILLYNSVNERGSLVGTSNSLSSLARLVAPLSSGFISDICGQSSTIYFSVILSLLGTLIAGFLNFRHKQKTD